MARKVVDCREYPNEVGCTLAISGEEEEVVRAATEHATSVHGEEDTPELREKIRELLRDDEGELYAAGAASMPPF